MLLVLGAGYIGAALADEALDRGEEVVLADNWYATRREQLETLEARGARVETADIRDRDDVGRLLALGPARVYLLAAQASRPLSEREPDYTEETNVSGTRRVGEALAEAGGPALVFASSLHVYGGGGRLSGAVTAEHPYGDQDDLAHLSKIYGELVLKLHARRAGFDLSVMRLAITYGPSAVEHDEPESQTVVDKFRRLAAAGREPTVDDPDVTIGVVHVADAARILLDAAPGIENVVSDTVTVGDVAALVRGEQARGGTACRYVSPFEYRHSLAEYLRGAKHA